MDCKVVGKRMNAIMEDNILGPYLYAIFFLNGEFVKEEVEKSVGIKEDLHHMFNFDWDKSLRRKALEYVRRGDVP